MSKKFPYVERDESWMYFNKRILLEAGRTDVPLLEKLNYLGIYSNNLDEFFRVRVASLRRIMEYNGKDLPKGTKTRTEQTLRTITKLNAEYSKIFEHTFSQLKQELEKEHIHIINEQQLTPQQREQVLAFYTANLNGSTNPIFLEKISFSPKNFKETLYLAVELTNGKSLSKMKNRETAIIEIPVKEVGRFIRLPDEDGESYIMFLDDVIRYCLPYIFTGLDYTYYEAYTFKFTKDAEMEFDRDLHSSVLEKISAGLQKRKRGEAIRMVYDASMPRSIQHKLYEAAALVKEDTLVPGGRYHNMRDLMSFPDCGRSQLKFAPQPPLIFDKLQYSDSILSQILYKDQGLHFPYYNFEHLVRVLREAAISKDVKAIKISLYRVAKNSKIIKALIAAAQNGKHITAVVELLARFDEASNISWSHKMKEAGINVVFGPEKLKIHSKLIHITTVHGDIACIGTGNLHEGTANVYTDYMLMTANKNITSEVSKVFDFIEKPFMNVHFKELIVSPNEMRKKFNMLITREIKNSQEGKPAYIKIKTNHIVDEKMVAKLYRASQAGVQIDLCVRGNCSVVPGVPGVSENIRINAIIDRYLEHSRIYIFCNGGDERIFIGSADWMARNLDRRIEVVTPVYDKDLKKELKNIVQAGLDDTSQGHWVNTNNGDPKRLTAPEPLFRSQTALYEFYRKKQQKHNHG